MSTRLSFVENGFETNIYVQNNESKRDQQKRSLEIDRNPEVVQRMQQEISALRAVDRIKACPVWTDRVNVVDSTSLMLQLLLW